MFNGNYEYDERLDKVVDEKANQFISVRFAKWKEGQDFQLEIRRFALSEDGETPLKGVRFLTDNGPHELTTTLVENGFGMADELVDTIIENRPAVAAKIYHRLTGDKKLMTKVLSHENDEDTVDESENLYDPKELLA